MDGSPARLLEMLSDRFGAFEAVAYSTITLSRHVSQDELSMDLLVAQAVLEFADDLRDAAAAVADEAAGGAAQATPTAGATVRSRTRSAAARA